MGNIFESIISKHVLMRKTEFVGITCLAVVGAMSIIGNIASNSYRAGVEAKEAEIRREVRRYNKELKKKNKKKRS